MTARNELLDGYGREVKVGDYVAVDSVVYEDFGVVLSLNSEYLGPNWPGQYWIWAEIDCGGNFVAKRACCEVAVITSDESLGLGMFPFG